MKDRKSERTSAQQLKWIFCQCGHATGNLWRHVSRFGLAYGFVCGVISGIAVIMAVIWYGILSYPAPWKIINPANQNFNPVHFRFSDYGSGSSLGHALSCLFPAGTEKKYVDHILKDIGHARVKKYSSENEVYMYSYDLPRDRIYERIFPVPQDSRTDNISFLIEYDDQLKIRNAKFLKNICSKEKR